MTAFVLWTVGLLALVGIVAKLLGNAMRADSWKYDENHVWNDAEGKHHRRKEM